MDNPVQNKVLVVDDDPAMLRLLTAQLGHGGYEVLTADTGDQALGILEQEQPAYLITDLDMPGMDGLELCRRVRDLELSRYLYIVFLSGRSDDDNLVAAMDAGADDFLGKPLRKQELQARLTAGARVLRREAQLSQLAEQDALSGLLLRRPFNRFLEKEWHRSRRFRVPLSVVMFDIDHFKQVNDSHGHPAGDQAIVTVANLIQQHARDCDVVCRYGGEEFCALLPETSEAMAATWADRLRINIAATPIPFGDSIVRVSVSAGVAEISADLVDEEQLLAQADQCLIAAKRAGRNCVVSERMQSDEDIAGSNLLSDGVSRRVLAREAMTPIVHSLRADWPLACGAEYILRHNVSAAPVTDESGNLLGILSEQDVLRVVRHPDVSDKRVADVMCNNVISYEETAPLSHVLGFLTRASLRHVVIVSAGRPRGLVTRASLIRWFLSNAWQQYDSDKLDCAASCD